MNMANSEKSGISSQKMPVSKKLKLKNKMKLQYLKTCFSLLLLSILIVSCSENGENVAEDLTNKINRTFQESVAMIGPGRIEVRDGLEAQTFTFKNFSRQLSLSTVYSLNGSLYSDDGQNNDLIPNDGIYTSHKLFNKAELKVMNLINSNFLFHDQLNQYLASNSNGRVELFTIGCQFDIVSCPNNNWWDTSYFGEPCVHLHSCYFEVSF